MDEHYDLRNVFEIVGITTAPPYEARWSAGDSFFGVKSARVHLVDGTNFMLPVTLTDQEIFQLCRLVDVFHGRGNRQLPGQQVCPLQ